MITKKYLSAIGILAISASLIGVLPALADSKGQDGGQGAPNASFQGQIKGQGRAGFGKGMMSSGVFGTVANVSGNTISVTSMVRRGFMGSTTQSQTTTTYSVDATNAVVLKNNATSSVSSISVGDNVIVQGTISGTSVTATKILDGILRGKGMPGQENQNGGPASLTLTGNGEPVVVGTIGSINGTTVTITNKSNVTYTIDASNAKVLKNRNASSTVSNLSVGDSILVQGNINGNSIVATTVIDQTNSNNTPSKNNGGFFGGIGQFFKHLFGF